MNLRLTIATVAALTIASANAAPVHVDHSVHRKLQETNKVDIVVTMKTKPNESLKNLESISFATRGHKIETMVNQLDTLAKESQKDIDAILAKEATTGQPLFEKHHTSWAMNARLINGASLELVEQLASLPGVESIREQFVASIVKSEAREVASKPNFAPFQWNIDQIEAKKVWAEGVTGQNVVVGSIDTGVRGTHEILRMSMRETYNWYDPSNHTDFPHDTANHGTHTMGTIVGASGFGVAPGAKWMACLGCRVDWCHQFDLVKCGEFMTCPTDTKGENKDCSKAPHVINNSWGLARLGETSYQPIVDAWHAAGIIPVFATGNSGPSCSSALSPGDYANVIGVGAMGKNATLLYFSGRGPAVGTGIMKPDIVAPGGAFLSSGAFDDTAYYEDWGTSMATPQVTGAVALLLSADPNLKYKDIYARLTSTADQSNFNLTASTQRGLDTCGGIKETVFPNNHYGYGRLNAFSAFKNLRKIPTQMV